MKKRTLDFVKKNGFEVVDYQQTGVEKFYRKVISDPQKLTKLSTYLYDVGVINYPFDTVDGIEVVSEIQVNGNTPQWIITGTDEEIFDVYTSEDEWVDFMEKLIQKTGI